MTLTTVEISFDLNNLFPSPANDEKLKPEVIKAIEEQIAANGQVLNDLGEKRPELNESIVLEQGAKALERTQESLGFFNKKYGYEYDEHGTPVRLPNAATLSSDSAETIKSLAPNSAYAAILEQAKHIDLKGSEDTGLISAFSSVHVDGNSKPLIEAMADNIGYKLYENQTGFGSATISPIGVHSFGLGKTLKAVLLNGHEAVEAIERMATIKKIEDKITAAKTGTVYDVQALVLHINYRFDSDYRIKTSNNNFIIQESGKESHKFTKAIGDYLPFFHYWVECLKKIRIAVGTSHKTFRPERYGKHIKLKRRKNGRIDYTGLYEQIKDLPFVVLRLPQGSGKTSVVAKEFMKCGDTENIMAISHRVKLVGDLNRLFEESFHYRDEIDDIDSNTKSVVTCINSLLKPKLESHFIESDRVFLDEAEQVMRHILGNGLNTKKDKGKKHDHDEESEESKENRGLIYNLLKNLAGKQIMLADADMSDSGIDFWLELSGYKRSDVTVVTVEDYDHGYEADFLCHSSTIIHGSTSGKKAAELLKKNKRVAMAFESKSRAEAIYDYLEKECPDKEILLITSDSYNFEKDLIESDASGFTDDHDCVIYTTAMGTGVSIEHTKNKFSHVFFVGSGSILTADDAIQMIKRFRDAKYFMFEVRVAPHLLIHKYFNHTFKTDDQLQKAIHHYLFNNSVERSHFATNLRAKLKERLYKITEKNDFLPELIIPDREHAPKIETILAARDITEREYWKGKNNDQQKAECDRYEVKALYGNVTPETVELFLSTTKRKRDENLTSALSAGKSSPERVLAEMVLSSHIIDQTHAKAILDHVRNNKTMLKDAGCIVDRWYGREVPNGTKAISSVQKLLGEVFGIRHEGKPARKPTKIEIISSDYQLVMLKHHGIGIEWPMSEEDQIIELHKQGLKIRAIEEKTGISKSKVDRILQKYKSNQ